MAFIQIIEVTTTRPEEIEELVEEWSARTEGRRWGNNGVPFPGEDHHP